MTTFRDILTGAYGYSAKNQPGKIVSEATEALALMTRAVRSVFLMSAQVNPEFFGATSSVAFSAPGWTRPAAALSVYRIEQAGTEVVVVPQFDKAAELAKPAVWLLGQVYRSAGNPLDPVGGSLDFYYTRVPDTPADLDSTVDALWVSALDDLLMLETAIYLALKVGRSEDMATLIPMRDAALRAASTYLQLETSNRVYRYGARRTINLNALSAGMAGGTP